METFLKRLELQGFKSFANKTTFNFPEKITGIVGPNGSGKSNIVDALRWVLGERAAKSLRGDSLENLIFAGTPKKPSSSFARVSLIFSNDAKIFELDASEVSIERKVDRSGVSQFYLNGGEIKLKDLLFMLARAKLGARGLTIIGQGQSDLFVKSNSKERRLMIEENLGLKEYRLKKDEAEKHLESSRINGEKVLAMIEELEPHVKFLKKQKNRWSKKAEIELELTENENKLFGIELKKINAELAKKTEPIEKLKAEKINLENQIKNFESNIVSQKEEAEDSNHLFKIRRGLEGLLVQKNRIEKEIVRLETKIEIQGNKSQAIPGLEEIRNDISQIYEEIKNILSRNDFTELEQKLKIWLKKLEKALGKNEPIIQDISPSLTPLERELASLSEEIKKLKNEESELIEKQQKHNQEFRLQVGKIESAKNELRVVENKLQTIKFETEKCELKIADLERAWLSAGREKNDLIKLAKIDQAFIEPDLGSLDKKIMRLRSEIAAIGEIDTEALKESEEAEKRYELLQKEYGDLQTATENLKKLIRELSERIDREFRSSFKKINDAFDKYFGLMFGGGKAKLRIVEAEPTFDGENPTDNDLPLTDSEEKPETIAGVEIEINIPRKKN